MKELYRVNFTKRDMRLYDKLKRTLPNIQWKCPCKFRTYDRFILASKQNTYNVFVEIATKSIVAAYFGSEETIHDADRQNEAAEESLRDILS